MNTNYGIRPMNAVISEIIDEYQRYVIGYFDNLAMKLKQVHFLYFQISSYIQNA